MQAKWLERGVRAGLELAPDAEQPAHDRHRSRIQPGPLGLPFRQQAVDPVGVAGLLHGLRSHLGRPVVTNGILT